MSLPGLDIQKATVYTPKPGDVVVLECGDRADLGGWEQLRDDMIETFGSGVKVVLISGMTLAGVIEGVDPSVKGVDL